MFQLFFQIVTISGADLSKMDLVGNKIYLSVLFIFPQAVKLHLEQGKLCHLRLSNQNLLILNEKGEFYYAVTSMLEQITSMILLKMTNWITICQ